MGANVQAGEWILLSENTGAVLSALERGETDGILPAACGFMDRFAQFLIDLGVPSLLDAFPDHRERRSIAPFLFCNLLLHKSLFRLDSLSEVGPFLFSSPDVMRTLGFNMRQIQEGFYSGSGQRPFNVEAIGDFFAGCELGDFLSNQKEVIIGLIKKHPEIVEEGTLIMDCMDLRIPSGHNGRGEVHLEICVVCAWSRGEALPILWSIIPANSKADITQGKAMMDEVMAILGKKVKRLIVDRGFISGKWVTELKRQGIDTVIGLRTDMAIHVDMIALSQLPETVWLEAEPPKCKNQPLCRHIAYLSDLETWDGCAVPLSGIVIRDMYADKVVYQTVVTTDISAKAERIHEWIRTRWAIEETFMEESRYGSFNKVGACRVGVAAAIAHFSLLAYTLLRLFARKDEADRKTLRPALPTAGIRFVAYWREYYAIIFPSRFIGIVARCAPSWGSKLPSVLKKLKALEPSS